MMNSGFTKPKFNMRSLSEIETVSKELVGPQGLVGVFQKKLEKILDC